MTATVRYNGDISHSVVRMRGNYYNWILYQIILIYNTDSQTSNILINA